MDCSSREPNYEPPTDQNYGIEDLAPETMERIQKDCSGFQEQNGETISDAECSGEYSTWEQAGHDFWLTRNGHGAGFWDGDWSEPAGEQLTAAAKKFGELSLYVGDDGKLRLQ